MKNKNKICVVIPCYKVRDDIEKVLKKIDFKIVDKVLIIDDCCPEKTGTYIKKKNIKNVIVIINKKNLGVGGATIRGFKKALNMNFDIIFKIDGDNQHNPRDIVKFLKLFAQKKINFCKGSRFKVNQEKTKIPLIRLFGNVMLTNLSRINCKNKNLTDVVNGFIGIKKYLLKKINLDQLSQGFFFEEDLIFRISFLEKNIYEVPIKTMHNPKSNLNPLRTIVPFIIKHIKNFIIRLKYELLIYLKSIKN